MLTDEPQTLNLKVKGVKEVTAENIKTPGQVEIMNPKQHIATLTDKGADLDVEIKVERGLGFISKETLQKDKQLLLLLLRMCRIPDDHIGIRSWKLAAARDVLATLLTSLGVSKP